jgi:hypothetical protein
MANQTIAVPAGQLNLSPTLFHEYAIQYLQCERLFNDHRKFSPIPYFLVCRAIELELKARHLEHASRLEVKDQYRHNLQKSYDTLPAAQRTLDASEYAVLVTANNVYDNKGFEYVSVYDAVTGMKNFPVLVVLEQIAAKLIESDA